jgi:hypothetical protein
MMELPHNAISELRAIYKAEFGVDLTEDAAKAEARRLLLFFYEFLLFKQEKAIDSDFSTTPSSQG